VFQQHLDLAKEFDLPIVVHCRGAWRECLDMIVASGVKKAVFHWYSGPMDVLKDILDAGFLISGSVALEYSAESRKAMEYAPLERILVETDTPVRGWTPKDVWRTFKALCAIKAADEEKALAIVNANASVFFNIS
jgi:TatD DNase family protein